MRLLLTSHHKALRVRDQFVDARFERLDFFFGLISCLDMLDGDEFITALLVVQQLIFQSIKRVVRP